MIKAKEDEFLALQERVDMFKASVLAIFEQEIDLISKLPEIEKETVVMTDQEPVVQMPVIEETASVAVEETATEVVVADEPKVMIEEIAEEIETAEENETVEEVEEEIPVVQTSVEEEPADELPAVELVKEADTTVETSEESVVENEYKAEQIDIEELIAVKPSPVEPEAPELPVIDEEDAPAEEREDEFHLFGTSPLVFPTDIPDDEDESPFVKEKGSRFKKKLKFGVDFDVKKDK